MSLTTLVAVVQNPVTGKTQRLNALADGGADHTVLSSRAARWLELEPEDGRCAYKVKGHGGRSEIYDALAFKIRLLGPGMKPLRKLTVKSYPAPCGDLTIEDWSKLKHDWKHLKELPLPAPEGDGVVDLILGTTALDLIEAVQPSIFGPAGGPVAKMTQLGWVVGGKMHPDAAGKDSEGRLNSPRVWSCQFPSWSNIISTW